MEVLFATKEPTLWQITLAGIIVCHISSYISTLLIWAVSHRVVAAQDKSTAAISFLAAVLYIVSPAGIFLSAPYTESPFAVLNMSAYLAFFEGRACFSRDRSIAGAFFTVSAGVFAALGTIMRSNGILSGGLFAWDAALSAAMLLKSHYTLPDLIRLGSLGLAGVITGLGALLPQYLAYVEYCTPGEGIEVRSWCKDTIPSIFTFVQSHYWYVRRFQRLYQLTASGTWVCSVTGPCPTCLYLPWLHLRCISSCFPQRSTCVEEWAPITSTRTFCHPKLGTSQHHSLFWPCSQ